MDCFDDDMESPLHLAANGGHAHVVDLLLTRLGDEKLAKLLGCPNAEGKKPADLAEDPALIAALSISGDNDDDSDANQYKRTRH